MINADFWWLLLRQCRFSVYIQTKEKVFSVSVYLLLDASEIKQGNKLFAEFYTQMVSILKKQIVTRLDIKFPAFHGTLWFIAIFTRACPLSLCRTRWFQLCPVSFKSNCNTMLSFMPWSSALFQFRNQSFVCIFHLYHALITLILGWGHKWWSYKD